MTVGTFDLVIGDVFLVKNLGGVFRTENDGLIMAFDTFSFGNMSIALNHAEVTCLTGHPSFNIFPMVEAPISDFNVSLRFEVTRGATADGA